MKKDIIAELSKFINKNENYYRIINFTSSFNWCQISAFTLFISCVIPKHSNITK